jgi:succinyl-CoA synthetase alpha subunit
MAALRSGQTVRQAQARISSFSKYSNRSFTSSARRNGYDDTVQNLRIGKHTRVIYQGFTGRVATGNAKDSLEYGTNIVGGVTPGKEGEHLGLPLLPDLKKAKEQLKPDATAVFVAAPQCGKAIEDAIEAEIPLIVSVAEHIPLHDMMRVCACH